MARPRKAKGDEAVQVTVTARARDLIDDELRGEWAAQLDRGEVPALTPQHYIAKHRRARISELIEARYGPDGRYRTTVKVELPLPERMTEAETREVQEWSERLLAQLNDTLPAPVRAAIAANEVRLDAAHKGEDDG